MRSFRGVGKRKTYFEGWYLKHSCEKGMIAFIPSFHLDDQGKASSSLQVITSQGVGGQIFPSGQFQGDSQCFRVQIGVNQFSTQGINVDVQTEKIAVCGQLRYESFTVPRSDLMGPFRFVPWMQCHHGVLSLTHGLQGTLLVNGCRWDFADGRGYIEKDWGCSFPRAYFWTQVHWFDRQPGSLMLSIADIPFLGGYFTGCLGAIWYGGREYRLATYKGAKIRCYSPHQVEVEQGCYRLQVELLSQYGFDLQAPKMGAMSRI
ncbi:MAG: tocopherol cyclase family protein, partial [Clostridiales bacterium]